MLVADRYRRIRSLGSGGMASVFLAEDMRLGRQVAVKRLRALGEEEAIRRFEREARLGAGLNHPNLVQIYDTARDGDDLLIVMEYVDGSTLEQRLEAGPLDPAEAVEVLRGAAAGLDYAHEHGVVHRDVKPANLLLRRDGTVKVADLGIATAAEVSEITAAGSLLGTPTYLAPELFAGERATRSSDVYALAAIAFEALSGRKSQSGDTALEVAYRITTEPPPDLRAAWPSAPEDAIELLRRGLARDPGERPGSAGELVDELGQALTAAPPPTEAAAAIEQPHGAVVVADEPVAYEPDTEPTLRQPLPEPEPEPAPAPAPEPAPAPAPEPAPEPEPEPAPAPPRARAAPATPPRARRGRKVPRAVVPALVLTVVAAATVITLASRSDGNGDERPPATPAKKPQGQADRRPQRTPSAPPRAAEPPTGTALPDAPEADAGTDPAEGRRLNDRGFALVQQGEYAEAVPVLQRAVEQFPSDSDDLSYGFALFNLGRALRLSGRPAEAIPVLERRAQIPNQPEVVQAELEAARRDAGG